MIGRVTKVEGDKSMNPKTFLELCTRWKAVKEYQVRAAIAKELGIDATNLDSYLGIISTPDLRQIFPKKSVRNSQAAKYFDTNMKRYKSISEQANSLGASSRTKKPIGVAHLREASLVLAMGSIDAYIRNLVIDESVRLFFDPSPNQINLKKVFVNAIKRVVEVEPELIITLATLKPAEAKKLLAERVFDMSKVRILTGSYDLFLKHLEIIDIKLEAMEPPKDSDACQFLKIAPTIFDSFSTTRHQIVHTGVQLKNRTGPYCSNQEPEKFLGSFLDALVTTIENLMILKKSRK